MMNTGFNEFEKSKLEELTELAKKCSYIDLELFVKYQVKRGLRDLDGKGVLVGLTEIGEVHSYIIDENEIVPVPGRLIYRGIDIFDLVDGFIGEGRFGFEETVYLLLFGDLPNKEQLGEFEKLLASYRELPEKFLKDMILNLPGKNIMNVLARSVLAYYSYDCNPDDTSVNNVLKQCIRLIACMPTIAVYAYQALSHYYDKKSLVIHPPRPDLSTAENILHMLRPDSKYTELEA